MSALTELWAVYVYILSLHAMRERSRRSNIISFHQIPQRTLGMNCAAGLKLSGFWRLTAECCWNGTREWLLVKYHSPPSSWQFFTEINTMQWSIFCLCTLLPLGVGESIGPTRALMAKRLQGSVLWGKWVV